jgi:hypothetical protein
LRQHQDTRCQLRGPDAKGWQQSTRALPDTAASSARLMNSIGVGAYAPNPTGVVFHAVGNRFRNLPIAPEKRIAGDNDAREIIHRGYFQEQSPDSGREGYCQLVGGVPESRQVSALSACLRARFC